MRLQPHDNAAALGLAVSGFTNLKPQAGLLLGAVLRQALDLGVNKPPKSRLPHLISSAAVTMMAMAAPIATMASLRASRISTSFSQTAPYLYLLPTLLLLALWNYYPLLFLVDLSFHKLDASSPAPSWVGLTNYR